MRKIRITSDMITDEDLVEDTEKCHERNGILYQDEIDPHSLTGSRIVSVTKLGGTIVLTVDP